MITNRILKSFIEAWHTLNIKPSYCRLLDLAFKDWDWSFDDVDDIDGDDDDDDDVFDFWRSIRGKSKQRGMDLFAFEYSMLCWILFLEAENIQDLILVF